MTFLASTASITERVDVEYEAAAELYVIFEFRIATVAFAAKTLINPSCCQSPPKLTEPSVNVTPSTIEPSAPFPEKVKNRLPPPFTIVLLAPEIETMEIFLFLLSKFTLPVPV